MDDLTWHVSAMQVVGLVAGFVLFGCGFWVLWLAKFAHVEQRVALPLVNRMGFGWVGVPTALTLGLCLLIVGYHAAVWSLPQGLDLLAVPRDRWWMLVVGVGAAATLTGLAEWLEQLDRERDGDGE